MTNVTQPIGIDSFEIAKKGTITITKPANTVNGTSSVAHNLGYIPAFLAFQTGTTYNGVPFAPSGYQHIPYYGIINNSGTAADVGRVIDVVVCYADTTNFYASLDCPNWSGNSDYVAAITWTIVYYLLRETAN